jgi:FKBP-type peptidyl-prolyl cis-trans isomerase SlyD
MQIADNCVVAIHYTLTDDSGATLDSSADGDPLSYIHGTNGLIPGLESELHGKQAGDEFQATVQPEEGYGVSDPSLVREVPLEALAQIENLSEGMQLQSQDAEGRTIVLVVESIGSESATLNANHALAGVVLHFAVTVETVREATTEELEHGHMH